jgi:hypothetical protein
VASHIGVRDLKDLVDCGNRNREFPIAVGVRGSSVRLRTGVIGVRGFDLHEKRVHEIWDITNSKFPIKSGRSLGGSCRCGKVLKRD